MKTMNTELHNIFTEICDDDEKGETNAIITEEWNIAIGGKSYWNIVEPHGMGRRNATGQTHINFCEENGLSSTRFKKPKRRLYTWKALGNWRHQLDYVLVSIDSETVWSMHKQCLKQTMMLTTTMWLWRSALDWRTSSSSKWKPRCDLGMLYAKWQTAQDTLEQKPGVKECKSENFGRAVEQYQEMCARYCEWCEWESRQESKKAMDYTGNAQ